MTERVSEASWRCARCGVIARWMPGRELPGPPAGWAKGGGRAYCLACRRILAADAGAATAPADTTPEGTARLRRMALLEFEIERDPSRPNGEIARAVGSSVPAVVRARRRLESRGLPVGTRSATGKRRGPPADPASVG